MPERVCILRLSAIGDCANVVPVVHTLRAARPDVEICWVTGRVEATLVDGLEGVDCLSYDKKGGRAALSQLKSALSGRRFDVLLDMHASWRANRISLLVSARRRIGFDRHRSRDGQRLFVNERIPRVESRHVVDGFLAFALAAGADEPVLDWRVPIPDSDRQRADEWLDLASDNRPIMFISPCSTHAALGWPADRYAAVADYAVTRHGMRCILVGGTGDAERRMGDAIVAAMDASPENLIGQTNLKQLVALFDRGRILITPDSGPAHIANATDIATIGLYAATDVRRSGPYRSRHLCVDYFAEAAARYRNSTPDALKWGTRIAEAADVMTLIPVDAANRQIDAIMGNPDE